MKHTQESIIVTISIDDTWALDIQTLQGGIIRKKDSTIRMGFSVKENKIRFAYPETLPKSIKNKTIKIFKLDGEFE